MHCLPFPLRDVNIFTIKKTNPVGPESLRPKCALAKMSSWKMNDGLWADSIYQMEKCANVPHYHCKGLPRALNLLSSLTCSLMRGEGDSISLQEKHITTGAKVLQCLESLLSRITLAKAPLEDLRGTLLMILSTAMYVYLTTVSESEDVSVPPFHRGPMFIKCVADRDFQCRTTAPSDPLTSVHLNCRDYRYAQPSC